MLSELRIGIELKTAKVAVIGLGYVGLPVAAEIARVGFDVLGIDIQIERVAQIDRGESPLAGLEPGLNELVSKTINSGKLRATSGYDGIQDREVILICVETPVGQDNLPRYDALSSALTSVGKVLKRGSLVIIESTIAPGTMDAVVRPVLEKSSGLQVNQDFYLGICPERVMPGKLFSNLRSLSRVVGGKTPETAEVMVAFYRHIVEADLDAVDCVTAELVKTVENAYRDVQIAFANEIALICEQVGGDVWKVRQLVNKSPGRQMLLAGSGVGGHCIPKDSWLLASSVKGDDTPITILPAARSVNDYMPVHMAEIIVKALAEIGLEIAGSKVLILGYAYLEDTGDTRNSPSQILAQRLLQLQAEVIIHDPFVPECQGSVLEMARNCNAAVLMVKHTQYRSLDMRALKQALSSPILVDGRGFFDADIAIGSGLNYWALGIAKKPR